MPSISFDRAADYYDATRAYAPGTAERIRDAIVRYTGADATTRFLELGVGTGRIALPFIRAGYDYTGVDISEAMMDHLRAQIAGDPDSSAYRYDLRQADITALPFDDSTFRVIIAVHVLHLVDDWQLALREARRALQPGGWLLIGHDTSPDEDAPIDQAALPSTLHVLRRWNEIHRELGHERSAGRSNIWGKDERLTDYLQSLGAMTTTVALVEHERPAVSAGEMAGRLKARMYSSDWRTPDDVHAEASRRLDEWLEREVANPDEPVSTRGVFTAITAQF